SPDPVISNRWRCSGVAFASRHDHASGTLTLRPSASWAAMASSVTSSATMRGSLLATVLIPGLPNTLQVADHGLPDTVQLFRGEAAVEEEAVRTGDTGDRRHGKGPQRKDDGTGRFRCYAPGHLACQNRRRSFFVS